MQAGTKSRSRIISIGTAVPEFGSRQDTILGFMHNAYHEPVASRKLNILFQNSGIEARYSVVPDFMDRGGAELFHHNNGSPAIEKRIVFFKQKALPLAIKAIEEAFGKISKRVSTFGVTHLITVTCTGLHSPGLDAGLIEYYNLPSDIFHTSLNFLGCNAAFPALRLADSIVRADPSSKVLIVCVELCTLHFQPKANSDNLLSNTIFGDGAAAVIMEGDGSAGSPGFVIHDFQSSLFFDGKDLMGWNLTSLNFEMILNAGVPGFLGRELVGLKKTLSSRFRFDVDKTDYWAVHPGGKKILDEVKQQLHLSDEKLFYSYKVLKEYGNMSSPTVLFVMAEIWRNGLTHGDSLLSMGFGPGISVESALMYYEDSE